MASITEAQVEHVTLQRLGWGGQGLDVPAPGAQRGAHLPLLIRVFKARLADIEAGRTLGDHLDPSRSSSPSFAAFDTALLEAVG